MSNGLRVIGRVARHPRLRRIELGYLGFAIAEHGTWLATIIYAYDRGGVDEAGVVGFLLLGPAILVAPFAAFAADRFESGKVLAAGYAIQATSMIVTGALIAASVPALLVYVVAAIAATSVTLTRPALGVVLPASTHTPADLTAANVIVGFVEYVGMFVGPAVAGLLVRASGTELPFLVFGAALAVSTLLALGLDTPPPLERDRTAGPVADTIDGLRALRREPKVQLMIVVVSISALIVGATDVLVVATADQLDGDTARAGLFGMAFGLGAVLGSVCSVVLVGRARLTPFIATAIGGMGLLLAFLPNATTALTAVALYGAMGVGESVSQIASTTLIQRVAPSEVAGRFFGAAEGVRTFVVGVGSLAVGAAVAWLGYEDGLLVAGVVVTLTLLCCIGGVFRIDRGAIVPDERVLALIGGDPVFASLPAPVIERLVADSEWRHVPAGHPVITEGDRGDHYFIIDRGDVEVTMAGTFVRRLGPGKAFGEIALMRDVPRTATVTASADTDVIAIARTPFLQAVTGQQRSTSAVVDRAADYVDADRFSGDGSS